jgi:hypothetical protein
VPDIALIGGAVAVCASLRGLAALRLGAWLTVAVCGVVGLRLAGHLPTDLPGEGWLTLWPGASFALVLGGLVGGHSAIHIVPATKEGISGPSADLALALSLLSVATGGLIACAGLVLGAVLVVQAEGRRWAALMLAGLMPCLDGAQGVWMGAALLSATLAFPGTSPVHGGRTRGMLAVAACLVAWHVGSPPVWVGVIGAALAVGGVSLLFSDAVPGWQMPDRLAIAHSLLLLGLSAETRDTIAPWVLFVLGWGVWPAGRPLWRLVCPPTLGGWSLWLALHDAHGAGDPMVRAGLLGALLACVALEWIACWRLMARPQAADRPWDIFAGCVCAVPGLVLVLARPLTGGSRQDPWSLTAVDGAVVHPWLFAMAAAAIGFGLWRTGHLGPTIVPSGEARIAGPLPNDLLRLAVRVRRGWQVVRKTGTTLAGWRADRRPQRSALLLWLAMLAAGLLWETGR